MQQHAEIPQHWVPKETDAPLTEKITKEQSLFMRLGKAAADMASDIRSANDMAKRKFDGDSALMRVARGALTGAVGAGLELATDDMFSKAWRGEGPIFERFIMGESAGKKLAALSKRSPRLSHFIKEGTQDVALAALYNFIAYRSQPIFTQVESQHVIRSLTADALEAGFLQSIPAEMQNAAANMKPTHKDKWQRRGHNRGYKPQPQQRKYSFGPEGSEQMMQEYFHPKKDVSNKSATKINVHSESVSKAGAPERSGLVGNLFNLSNPVTQLGVEMMWSGLSTFAKNYKDLRKTRKLNEWSGGKASTAPSKGENVYYGNSYNKYNKKRGYDERLED